MNESEPSMRCRETVLSVKTTGSLMLGKEWGDKGYGWMPYNYILNNLALDFWSLLGMNWVDSKQFGI